MTDPDNVVSAAAAIGPHFPENGNDAVAQEHHQAYILAGNDLEEPKRKVVGAYHAPTSTP